jgi:ribosome maturation factor RimP
MNSMADKIREIAIKAASDRGLEFVHSEIAGTKRNAVVRIFVDKDGGVTIDDCSMLSRDVEEVLDEHDIIPSAYVLEVSSPGLERELYSIDDFRKFVGSQARVKTKMEISGRKTFKGSIDAVEGEAIRFTDRAVGEISFPYEAVSKANLLFDIADDLKKG